MWVVGLASFDGHSHHSITPKFFRSRPVALTARAPDSKSGCWGFESLLACQAVGIFAPESDMEKIKEFLQKAKQFFREVRVELKKVTWPSRKETIAATSVVLITVILVAFFLGLVDLGLSRIIKIFLD
jgi:preprotein translocase SecE subunit